MARVEVNHQFDGGGAVVRPGLSAEMRAAFLRGAVHIKARMMDGSFSPLATRGHLTELIHQNEDTRLLAEQVFEIVGQSGTIPDFGEVPEAGDFSVVYKPYMGADGRRRHPLRKYVPSPIAPHLEAMQEAYASHLREEGLASLRPGLILESAYRSPYYQVGVMAKAIGELGREHAEKAITKPGTSQHAKFKACAFDIQNIGDAQGSIQKRDGSPIGFEQTQEFTWLLKNSPEYGFWLPYFPNPEDPTITMGTGEIIVEPWHFQFVNGAAEQKTQVNRIRELFPRFAAARQ